MDFQKIYSNDDHRVQDQSIWMLPHSALMLVLMIMFAALYTYSFTNSVKYEKTLTELLVEKDAMKQAADEVDMAANMREYINRMKMQGLADVTITPHEIKLKLSSPTIFDTASAEIKPDIMPLLMKLYEHLRQMDNIIVVEGHTDNIPISTSRYKSNWELSAARAFSVIYFYIQRGIAPERLVAHGFGEFRPRAENDTQLGRALNRRIEIIILRGEI